MRVGDEEFLRSGAKQLKVSDVIIDKSLAILIETEQEDITLSSRSRRTKCASAIYITLLLEGKHINQITVAAVFDTTEVSVRSVHKQMLASYLRLHPSQYSLPNTWGLAKKIAHLKSIGGSQ